MGHLLVSGESHSFLKPAADLSIRSNEALIKTLENTRKKASNYPQKIINTGELDGPLALLYH